MNKPGIIYVTRNLVNRKIYVGLHTRGRSDYLGSGRYLKNAVNKYGRENFIRTELDTFLTPEEGHIKERRWITALGSKAPTGYNLVDGGEGGLNPCPETRARISAIVSANNPMKRPEVRAKVSAAQTGKHPSAETRAKISAAGMGNKYTLGYRHTDGAKAKLRAANIGNSHNLGKHLSDAHRAKLRAALNQPEVRAKLSANSSMRRPEVRAKNSASHKGQVPWNKGLRGAPLVGRIKEMGSNERSDTE